jgi:hypothetical protein
MPSSTIWRNPLLLRQSEHLEMESLVSPLAEAKASILPPVAASALVSLRDDHLMRLWRREGTGSRLVVCCSGVGRHDDKLPEAEFNRLAYHPAPDHLLFFADPMRTWLNAPGLIEALVAEIEAEARRTGATEICMIGHSMGAYAAMILPAFTKVDVALAFSPQYVVDPTRLPEESRWENWRSKIDVFRIASVADHLVQDCQYFVFHGRNRREAVQRDLVQPRGNLDMFILPGTYHRTPKKLKELGVLDAVIAAAFAKDRAKLHQIMQGSVSAEIVSQGRAS